MCFSRRYRWDDERESRHDRVWDLFERETREAPPVEVADREPEVDLVNERDPDREGVSASS
jgi:hypothetical protein